MYPFSCINTFSQFASLEWENNGSRSTTTHTHTQVLGKWPAQREIMNQFRLHALNELRYFPAQR